MTKAVIYRMVMPEHLCPFGLKSKDLLERKGYEVEDHWLTTREETDAFKQSHHVETTPQTFIDGERVGGYDGLRRWMGMKAGADAHWRYTPVAVVFACAALAALALQWFATDQLQFGLWLEWFVALSMLVLAILKLRDLEAFSNQFLGYDLLSQRVVRYAYVYPFAEAFAALTMLGQVLVPVGAVVALFIGTVGAVSVFKAVYIDKRELKCACVGGNSNVPLGFVSLTENLMMVGMGLWMLLR